MKCYNCNAELSPNAKFCRHCGKEIVSFCSNCGLQLEKDAKFCTGCGAEVEEINTKEEKKTDVLPTMGEIALEMTEKVLEKVEGDNHSTHFEEIRNAKPAQVETPARSEMPATPQTSTHSGGSAGGAGQKIRRDSVSVRDAAARQGQAAPSEATPVPSTTPAQARAAAQPQAATAQEPVQPQSAAAQTHAPVAAQQPAQPTVSQGQLPLTPQTPVPAQVQTAAYQTNPATPPVQASPIQTQAPVQAPVRAPVSHAAPVAPHIPTAPVASAAASVATEVAHAAGSAASSVATEVAHAAGAVAVAGVKKAGSTAKTIAIWAAVIAFVIGAATACLNFFVPAPEDTVDKLIESVEELKCDDMLSCFDSTTEKQIRAVMGITGDLMGSLTGISLDLEDLMAMAPSLAPYMEIPDLGIADAETVLYADCSKSKLMQYCQTANSGGSIPTGYLSDNELVSFLMEYNISLPGLENLIAQVAVVKITLKTGEVGYLPLINEGWGDWRIPMMDLMGSEGLG